MKATPEDVAKRWSGVKDLVNPCDASMKATPEDVAKFEDAPEQPHTPRPPQ